MDSEPLWRKVLCWGSVILFLTLPVLILLVRLVSDSYPDFHWSESLRQAKFMVPYFQSLTALIFGLAGLNTWDRRSNGRSRAADKQPKKDPPEH
jgi:hypothetical protein